MLITKLPSSTVIWLFCLIVSPVSLIAQMSRKQQQLKQRFLVSDNKPLLRFSFAKFLVNPCGLMPSSSLRNDMVKSIIINQILMTSNHPTHHNQSSSPPIFAKMSSLSQEALLFIYPFRQQYNVNRHLFTAVERKAIIEEFLLVIREIKQRLNFILLQAELSQCESIQLPSQSDFKLINKTFDSNEEFDMKEIYRALAITVAHLHMIIRDTLFVTTAEPIQQINKCAMDTDFQLKNIRVLTGKVETLMCLIFPLWIIENKTPDQLFHVIHGVLQTSINHVFYSDCSAREMQQCLVVRFAQSVFDVVLKLGLSRHRELSSDSV